MIALLDDMTILHDQNHIGLPDRGQTMGNDKAGTSLHHLLQRPPGSVISVRVSMEEVASSRISIGGRHSITRAMQSSCFCPWDRLPPSSVITVS